MSGELDPAAFAEAPHVRPASIRAWGIAGHECHRLPSPLGEILQEIARSDALGQERTLLVAQVPVLIRRRLSVTRGMRHRPRPFDGGTQTSWTSSDRVC